MSRIRNFFLGAKHWQIFFAFIAFSITTGLVSPDEEGKTLVAIGVATYTFTVCFVGWFWSMGSFLNSLLPHKLQRGMGFFTLATVYPLIYMPIFFVLFALWFRTNPSNVLLIFPFHCFAVFCMFYLLYFASKSLVVAESGKAASFYDYAGPFFLLWFFPVGVWITQPRINRLFAAETNEPSSEI